jgi:DHA2 family multidrug resistance protein
MKWQKGELFRIIGLYLLIIPFLNALNATSYVNSQIQGYFGASGTEFMYMNLIPVFVLVAGIPLALAIAKQFRLRQLMFAIIIISFVLNTLSAFSPDIFWFTLFRSLLSFFSIFGILASLIPIVMRYNPVMNMAIMYGIVQFIIQGSSLIYKFTGAHFAHIFDWRTSVMLVNINFLACIILTWFFISNKIPFRQAPFSFDFKGWGLMVLFMLPLLFMTAEGLNRGWFSDEYIILAVGIIFCLALIYFLYSRNRVNPIIDLKVFTYRNVAIGTILYFLTGALNGTGSVITGFMGNILGFDDLYMARTNLIILAGLSVSIPLCTWMLYKRMYLNVIAISGFLFFALFHILMYFRFYPGIAPADFLWPFIFKGIGIGFLYVLSSLYISENVPKHLSGSRMMSGVIARVIFAILLGGSVLSTYVSKLNTLHNTGISQQITEGNKAADSQYDKTRIYYLSKGLKPGEADKHADDSLRYETGKSSLMLAYKDIYLVIAAGSFITALAILLLKIGRRPVQKIEVEPIPV